MNERNDKTVTVQKTGKRIKLGLLLSGLGFWLGILSAGIGITNDADVKTILVIVIVGLGALGVNVFFRVRRWWNHD